MVSMRASNFCVRRCPLLFNTIIIIIIIIIIILIIVSILASDQCLFSSNVNVNAARKRSS